VRVGRKEVYHDFQFWHAEVLGRSISIVCGLRRHSNIVSFNFWESSLLDLWVRQLDALANDREHQGILFD
jgi:hypothetical protein